MRQESRLAASVGLAAHPHMLRHALASAMAAHKEPASIIAAQLRHADGGALAQRVYIHQLPQTAPRLAELIGDVYGPASRNTQATSALRPAEGNQALQAAMTSYAGAAFPKLRDSVAGTGFEPVKAMPAIYRSDRRLLAGPGPSLPAPDHGF